jgi:hypothetical protein
MVKFIYSELDEEKHEERMSASNIVRCKLVVSSAPANKTKLYDYYKNGFY